MPLTPEQASVIGSAAGLAGQGITAGYQMGNNMMTLAYNAKAYAQQRRDSLKDWNMQNAYNHPREQMQRLKDAGLNPNLVYGNGATTEAGAVRSTEAKQWSPDAPNMDIGSAVQGGLMSYYDMKLREAQTDNVKANTAVAVQEAVNKSLIGDKLLPEITSAYNRNRREDFELGKDYELRQTQIDQAKYNLKSTIEGINQTRTNVAYTKNQDKRAEAMNTAQIVSMGYQNQKTQHEIHNLQKTFELLEKEGVFKELANALAARGMTFNDPWYVRQLAGIMKTPAEMQNKYLGFFKHLIKQLKQK